MPPLFAVLVFLATLLAIEAAGQIFGWGRASKHDRIRARLRAAASRKTNEALREGDTLIKEKSAAEFSSASLRRMGEELELLLYRAGRPMSLVRFFLLSAFSAVTGWAVAASFPATNPIAPFGLLAAGLPWLLVRRAARKRMIRFEQQLPDALELLTRALRAGHAIATGFQLVGDEVGDPVGTEFAVVAEEMRFGLELREALQNLMARVENPDLPYFATAVLIQRQTGGNLAEILDNLGGLLRERTQFHGRVRALTAQGRGAALVLALWLPLISVLVYFTAPKYFTPLFENTWGHAVLIGVALLDLGSYVMARRIATVEA